MGGDGNSAVDPLARRLRGSHSDHPLDCGPGLLGDIGFHIDLVGAETGGAAARQVIIFRAGRTPLIHRGEVDVGATPLSWCSMPTRWRQCCRVRRLTRSSPSSASHGGACAPARVDDALACQVIAEFTAASGWMNRSASGSPRPGRKPVRRCPRGRGTPCPDVDVVASGLALHVRAGTGRVEEDLLSAGSRRHVRRIGAGAARR